MNEDAGHEATRSQKLSAYLDGELAPDERREVEELLSADIDAAALLDDLRRLRDAARSLEDRPPPRDLWPRLARQLVTVSRDAAGALDRRKPTLSPRRRRLSLSPLQLVAASLLLMLLSSGMTALWLQRSGALEKAAPNGAGRADLARRQAPPISLRRPQAKYEIATAELERAFERGKSTLDSTTVEALERNLRLSSRAIAQLRAALDENPDDVDLAQLLRRALQRRFKLLQKAVDLASRTI